MNLSGVRGFKSSLPAWIPLIRRTSGSPTVLARSLRRDQLVVSQQVPVFFRAHEGPEGPLDDFAQRRMDVHRIEHRLRALVRGVHQIDGFLDQAGCLRSNNVSVE